jgi:hypothetical protein
MENEFVLLGLRDDEIDVAAIPTKPTADEAKAAEVYRRVVASLNDINESEIDRSMVRR